MEFNVKRMGLVLAATLLVLFGTLNAALAWTLSGTVYGGSNPLPGATVTLTNAATSAQVGSVSTDTGGKFSFNADNGTYNLAIAPPAGSGFTASTVNNVAVSGADVTQNIVLIQQAVTLSGAVRTPAGVGMQNVKVSVLGQSSSVVIAEDYTDANGNYSIPIGSGSYRMNIVGGASQYGYCGPNGEYQQCPSNVAAPDYFQGVYIVQNLSVSGNTTQNITVPLVSLTGKTTDGNGAAVGNVTVRQTSRSVSQSVGYYDVQNYSNVVSDSLGNYRMTLISATGYSLTLLPPAGSPYTQTGIAGVDVTTDTVRNLAFQQAYTISGTVRTPAGVGVQNIEVAVTDQAGYTVTSKFTDASGNYSISLSSGTYRLHVYGGSRYYGSCGANRSYQYCTPNVPLPQTMYGYDVVQSLAVAGNMTQNITIPLVTLSGKTTDGNGVSVADVTLLQPYNYAYQTTGYYYVASEDKAYAPKSDAAGNYSLPLISGTGYTVKLLPIAGGAQTIVSGIDVRSDTVRNLVLQQTATLSGRVKTSSGTGIGNVQVTVRPQASDSAIATVYTDASGAFAIPVTLGTYKLSVAGGSDYWGYCGPNGAYQQCLSSIPTPQYFEGSGILQNLAVTGDKVQDIVLPLVVVSGKTTDSNGRSVPNVTVKQTYNYVYPGSGYYYVTNESSSNPIKSDASGNYSLTLIAGTGYSETITPPAGSGFAPAVLTNVDATRDFSQSIILNLPDTTAPQILSGPTVSSFTDTTATIEWQTNEPAKGSVVYGTVDPPGSSAAEQAFVSSHSVQLTALAPNTKYYIKVTASDAAGNGPTASQVVNFTTAPRPDTTPPTVTTGPTVSSITQGSAVIEWTTDEPTIGSVIYGLSTLPDTTVEDSTLSGSHRVALSGLAADTVYYVKVTATDAAKNGPVSTSVASFRTLTVPDTTAPRIVEGPMEINVTDTGATIVWKTDEPATSGVSYDDGVAYGVLSDGALTTSHSMTITGLGASKNYNFTVSSKDESGNGPTLSAARSFSTKAAPDTNAPVFTQLPIVKETTHQSAVLYWETDEPASSTIRYGATQALELTDAKSELNTRHNRALTGLLPGTTYYFSVQATDAQKNSATSKVYSFTTDLNPDTKPPVITEAANIVYSTDNSATVAFVTDKPCDTVVNYGPNGSLAFQRSDSEKVNEHQMSVTNLTPNTSYNVEVSCTDISGNKVVAWAGTPSTLLAMNYSFMLSDAFVGAAGGVGFITKSQGDTTAPVITNAPRATATTSTMVRIQWVTDEIADSQVFFGLTGQSLTSSAGSIVKSAGHSVALTNLKPGTTYDFKVQSTDPSNNTVVSGVYSFTTAAVADTTAPVISAISATGTTSSRIEVAWNTDEQATTVLLYGTTPFTMTGQASVTGSSTSHTVSLYNLIPGTTYYVAPLSADGSGNSVQGATQSVTLAGLAPASYTVTASAGAGGSVTPASQSVFSGYQLALAVKPNTGYLIESVTGCGGTLSGSVYTTAEITGNCTVSALFKSDGTLPPELATTATPPAGSYSGGTLMVKLSVNGKGAIYYTTDGTTPTVASAVYSGPIAVTGSKTLKFFAKDSTSTEAVRSAAYTVTATGQPGASYAGIKQGTAFTVSRSEGGRTATPVYTGSQTSFVDTGSLKPNTVYTYTVSSDLEGNSELLSIRTPLGTGWNIVAVPCDTTGVAPGTLFGAPVSAVYQWVPTGATPESSNSVLGSYKTVTSLLPGYGYFVKASTIGTTFNYNGAASPSSATVTLKPGWTMVANPSAENMYNIANSWLIDGAPLGDAVLSNKIGGGIYWWNGAAYESWSIVNGSPQVEPWKAYWILNLDAVNHTLSINAK